MYIKILLLNILVFNLFANAEENLSKLEQYMQEVQLLVGKVEVLEHKISILEQKISTLNPRIVDKESVKENYREKETEILVNNTDIFDIPRAENNTAAKNNTITTDITDKTCYELALAKLKENKLVEAEQSFAEFLTNYPKSTLVSNAYFWYGESFFKRNIFDKATINYLKSYKHAPKGAKAADALLKLGIALGELHKKQEACGIFVELETEFPDRPAASIKKTKDAKTKIGCNY